MITYCHEVMKDEAAHVRMNASVADIAARMRDEGVGFLPICDEQERVVGVVTDRDIVTRVVAQNLPPEKTPIADIMTREVMACRPTDSLKSAANLMAKHQKARIVVTDDAGKLCGVISLTEIAQLTDQLLTGTLLRAVSAREFRMRHKSSRPPPPVPVPKSSPHSTGRRG
jgi:CBS domain-containing protein